MFNLLTTILSCQWSKKFFTQLVIHMSSPHILSLTAKKLWETTKVLLKYNKMTFSALSSSTTLVISWLMAIMPVTYKLPLVHLIWLFPTVLSFAHLETTFGRICSIMFPWTLWTFPWGWMFCGSLDSEFPSLKTDITFAFFKALGTSSDCHDRKRSLGGCSISPHGCIPISCLLLSKRNDLAKSAVATLITVYPDSIELSQ